MAVDKRTPEFLAGLVRMSPEQLDEIITSADDLIGIALALDECPEAEDAPLFARLAVCARRFRAACRAVGKEPEIWTP